MANATVLKGVKFDAKYNVETATIYKGNTDALQIPPAGHALHDPTSPTVFDEIIVAAIDRDGKMTTPIEVWTDPDAGILWVLDGRGRHLDVLEVNRRRKERKCELVKPYIVPFNGDEKAAVARVREKNYHRRIPTLSGMALDLAALRKAGHDWTACAEILHATPSDAEVWGRRILPLAYCVPEVCAVVDARELPLSKAVQFGGSAPDGSKALGKAAQLALLKEMTAVREQPTQRAVGPKRAGLIREKLVASGATDFANFVSYLQGDDKALAKLPEKVQVAIREALEVPVKGPGKPGKEKKAKPAKKEKAPKKSVEAA